MTLSDFCAPKKKDEWGVHRRRRHSSRWEPESAASAIVDELFSFVRREEQKRTPTLEEKFSYHAERLKLETGHLSSPLQVMMHPSFQAIVGLSQQNFDSKRSIVRCMLQEVKAGRGDWFLPLSQITQENPAISPKDYGKSDKLAEAWLKWGKSRGFL